MRPTAEQARAGELTRLARAGLLLSSFAFSACTPVVADGDVFGVGIYSTHRSSVSEHSHVREVRGVGVLVFEGRLIVGYADVAALFCGPQESDVRASVRGAEVLLGRAADAEAERMAREAAQWAESAGPPRADVREPDMSFFNERDVP